MNLKKPAKESALADKWHGVGEFFHQFGKNIYFEDLGRFEEDERIGQAILGISEPETAGQCLNQIDERNLYWNRSVCTGCSVQVARLAIQKDCQDCQRLPVINCIDHIFSIKLIFYKYLLSRILWCAEAVLEQVFRHLGIPRRARGVRIPLASQLKMVFFPFFLQGPVPKQILVPFHSDSG